jgi:uncharacterized protein (TIGR02391 family)
MNRLADEANLRLRCDVLTKPEAHRYWTTRARPPLPPRRRRDGHVSSSGRLALPGLPSAGPVLGVGVRFHRLPPAATCRIEPGDDQAGCDAASSRVLRLAAELQGSAAPLASPCVMGRYNLTPHQHEILRQLVALHQQERVEQFVLRKEWGTPRRISPIGEDPGVPGDEADLSALEEEGMVALSRSQHSIGVSLRQRAFEAVAQDPAPGALDPETPVARLTLEGLHPGICAVAGTLFASGHYSQAIFEAFKLLEVRVREASGLSVSGRDLMAQAFSEKRPLICLAHEGGRSGDDEQEGFKLIFMGAIQGIRNPKGHELIDLRDPQRALEYLALASLLMRRLEDGIRGTSAPEG